jgi:hypothetical protein
MAFNPSHIVSDMALASPLWLFSIVGKGRTFKIIILITLNAIMAFTGLLFSVTVDSVYSFYSINVHNEAGTYMLITCIQLLLIGLLIWYVSTFSYSHQN